jgi:hypothetical protein
MYLKPYHKPTYSRCIDKIVIYSKGSDPPLTSRQKAHNMSLVGIKTLKVGMQHSDLMPLLLIALLSQNVTIYFKTQKMFTYYLKRSFQLGYTVQGCIICLPHARSNGRASGYSIAVCRYGNITYNLNTVTIIRNTTQYTTQHNAQHNTMHNTNKYRLQYNTLSSRQWHSCTQRTQLTK